MDGLQEGDIVPADLLSRILVLIRCAKLNPAANCVRLLSKFVCSLHVILNLKFGSCQRKQVHFYRWYVFLNVLDVNPGTSGPVLDARRKALVFCVLVVLTWSG